MQRVSFDALVKNRHDVLYTTVQKVLNHYGIFVFMKETGAEEDYIIFIKSYIYYVTRLFWFELNAVFSNRLYISSSRSAPAIYLFFSNGVELGFICSFLISAKFDRRFLPNNLHSNPSK